MEENKLNFNRNTDETLVVDSDGTIIKNVAKIYNNLVMNLGFCHDQLKDGTLTEGMKETHLSLAEHYTLDFLNAMNYDGILKKESEKRFAEIRALNEQNRELRSQLGEKVTNEDFRERAKNISKSIRKWWNIKGFGYVSDIQFTEYGHIKVKLSGMISEAYYDRDGRDTMENKINYLKEIGFDFDEDKEELLMNDKNIETLTNLITSQYPSAVINEITINPSTKSKRTYREIVINIMNLDDIKTETLIESDE